jgi:hypothetical protein
MVKVREDGPTCDPGPSENPYTCQGSRRTALEIESDRLLKTLRKADCSCGSNGRCFFQQKQRTVALSLVALAVISLLVGEVPKLRARLKERTARKNEEHVAALALDELRGWIQKFLEFTTTQTTDAFYGIVFGRLCQTNISHFESLHIPPLQLFADFSRILATRTEERKPSREGLKQSIAEFNSLVGLYSNYVVCPVYDKVPLKLRPEILSIYITEQSKTTLP